MFCEQCGHELKEGANFCPKCGFKIKMADAVKEYKCPFCGEILSSDDLFCPSCGKEIRGKNASKSVENFYNELNKADSKEEMVKIINVFPVPNTREDIFEFMFIASSNFDAKSYISNKNEQTVARAWMSKINQCYLKGKKSLTEQKDFKLLDELYKKAKRQISSGKKLKILLIISGFIELGCFILIAILAPNLVALAAIFLLGAIPSLIFGFLKKKEKNPVETQNTAPTQTSEPAPERTSVSVQRKVVEAPVQTVEVKEVREVKQKQDVVYKRQRIKPVKAPQTAYYTECPRCHFGIRYDINEVKAHRRWPNGFIYCPKCETPVGHNKYNHIEYEKLCSTICPKCHKEVIYDLKDVIQHRRWPNGYIDCPYCRTHLGHNNDNLIDFDDYE